MRIAQVAPLVESVPPKLYGGTERVVAWLVDELASLGHEATLFASGDSKTAAKLHAVWPRALRLGRPRTDPMVAQAALLEAVARHATEFDVIHAHIDWLHLPLLSRLRVPFLTTCHGRMDLPGFPDVVRRFPEAPFVSISENQRAPLSEANWIGTIYHGLPADLFRSSFQAGSYLAFLGRLTAEKGPEAAIRIAHAANMPLRIAAKVPRGERKYFKEKLEPQIDGKQVQLTGEVNDETKRQFLAGAAALLFPIDWPEPFGLVMIEDAATDAIHRACRGSSRLARRRFRILGDRDDDRLDVSVAPPFPCRPYPNFREGFYPELRTGQADFLHPALGQNFTPSPTARRAQACSGVRAQRDYSLYGRTAGLLWRSLNGGSFGPCWTRTPIGPIWNCG